MKVFIDTSVLVAGSEENHPHYERASKVLDRVTEGHDEGFISGHSLAEVFAALTRLPVSPRIQPSDATKIILDDLLKNFTICCLVEEDYKKALTQMADEGLTGGKIYDALLLHCAARCDVDAIYTFNVKDFQRLVSGSLKAKLTSP